jgi:enterochelin esterase-like enzyme
MNPLHSIKKLQAAGMPLPRMHLCCGKQDALVYEACAHFRQTLVEAGVPLGYEEGDGGHDIPFWDAYLESCFRFLNAD